MQNHEDELSEEFVANALGLEDLAALTEVEGPAEPPELDEPVDSEEPEDRLLQLQGQLGKIADGAAENRVRIRVVEQKVEKLAKAVTKLIRLVQGEPERAVMVSPDEVARVLAVPRRTIYRLCQNGTIRGVKIGNKLWRIPLPEVNRLVGKGE